MPPKRTVIKGYKSTYQKSKNLASDRDMLQGGGLGTSLLKGFNWLANKLIKRQFNNTSQRTISTYGNMPIIGLKIMRTPIMKVLNIVINLMSAGKFDEAKKKYNFDDMYHLALVATVQTASGQIDVIMEKNAQVNISTSFSVNEKTEQLNIPLNGKQLTVNIILNNALNKFGKDSFFLYDPLSNNCQFFISYLLQGIGFYNMQTRSFLYQNVEGIKNTLSQGTKEAMLATTNLGALVGQITGAGKTNKNEIAKQKAKERTAKQSADAKTYYDSLRKIKAEREAEELKKQEQENYDNEHPDEVRERDNAHDRELLRQIDVTNLKQDDLQLINQIKDASVRSRLQHEHNLQTRGFYKVVKQDIDSEKKRIALNNLFNSMMTFGLDQIPVVGSHIKDAYNSFGPELSKKSDLQFVKVYDGLREQYPELADGPYQKDVDLSEVTGGGQIANNLRGAGLKDGFELHAIKVNKNKMSLDEAKAHAENIAKKKKMLMKEMKNHYVFRVIPRTKFDPKSYRSKKVKNGSILLVFGNLKRYKKNIFI